MLQHVTGLGLDSILNPTVIKDQSPPKVHQFGPFRKGSTVYSDGVHLFHFAWVGMVSDDVWRERVLYLFDIFCALHSPRFSILHAKKLTVRHSFNQHLCIGITSTTVSYSHHWKKDRPWSVWTPFCRRAWPQGFLRWQWRAVVAKATSDNDWVRKTNHWIPSQLWLFQVTSGFCDCVLKLATEFQWQQIYQQLLQW